MGDDLDDSQNRVDAAGVKAQIISGEFSSVIARQKSGSNLEIGELLIAESGSSKILMQVTDLMYGSQLSQQSIELVSGLSLEENSDLEFANSEIRSYSLAKLKSLLSISSSTSSCKSLPKFLSNLRAITEEDLDFITTPKDPLFIGSLRSGSSTLHIPISLPGNEVLSHHILISASTGKGKSNLASVMLWNLIDKSWCGILVLDPHDEYYGRNKKGMKDHPSKKAVYYTPKNPPPGTRTLKINLKNIKPYHFNGAADWSDPQREALNAYQRKYGDRWIEALLLHQESGVTENKDSSVVFNEATIAVVKRRLLYLLNLAVSGQKIYSNGIFDVDAGTTTISDMVGDLEKGKMVIIDTSSFSGNIEILVGSLIATEVFNRYRNYKVSGELDAKPTISILLEEAPRVLGKEVLEKGTNIFSTIAREGRKFKVGLTAITQLPSLIPKSILANMNTKIIMGMELSVERKALIESASQDISDDERNIASLDKGEALITSTFARFATPVKVPFFNDVVNTTLLEESRVKISSVNERAPLKYEGLGL